MPFDNDTFTISSDATWLHALPDRIRSVYLGKLLANEVFNEIHNTYKHSLLGKKKLVEAKHVGVWGWNSWCGIHVLPLLVGSRIGEICRNTIDVGFTHLEPSTGLLPHAVLHENGIFGSRTEHKCYGGAHGEDYNLDNMICWAKMAMEYFLITGDKDWYLKRQPVIQHTFDFILEHFRADFNPDLIEVGIEGDWTECTNWRFDNANVNVNMIEALRLLVACMSLAGQDAGAIDRYEKTRVSMRAAFTRDIRDGGFWLPDRGYYAHGNDGKGHVVYGDSYFESTTNYLSVLWEIASPEHEKHMWEFLDAHVNPIELPYPVLTNYLPRTGARRNAYGRTVTNGDVWMVLGSHAAAARLQAGPNHVSQGTRMYKAIIDYEAREKVLHNCIYPVSKRVNDSWDPEIGNTGALYAGLVHGVLGVKLRSGGLEFNIVGLTGMKRLSMSFFFQGTRVELDVAFDGLSTRGALLFPSGLFPPRAFNEPRFILTRRFDVDTIR